EGPDRLLIRVWVAVVAVERRERLLHTRRRPIRVLVGIELHERLRCDLGARRDLQRVLRRRVRRHPLHPWNGGHGDGGTGGRGEHDMLPRSPRRLRHRSPPFRRASMAAAWAARPSARARAMAGSPSGRNCAAPNEKTEITLMKSSRLSGEANRAVPPVGMTWLGPAV